MVKAQVLKLNSAYMPIEIIPWEEAICLWYRDKAEILDSYSDKILHHGFDEHLRTWKGAMECPAVIRLYEFVKPKKKLKFYEPFTRKNIYERDHGKCQYCGKGISLSKMTYDHVIPKCQNGHTCWSNIVTSCVKCNNKKGGRTPQEAKMKVRQKPFAPIIAESYNEGIINRMKKSMRVMNNEKWKQWIYWNVELEQD